MLQSVDGIDDQKFIRIYLSIISLDDLINYDHATLA